MRRASCFALVLCAALLSVTAFADPAASQPSDDADDAAFAVADTAMRAQLKSYFSAEKSESLLFMGLGAASAAFAIAAFAAGGDGNVGRALKGAAVPVAVIGAIQLVVGSVVFFRTDAQVASLLSAIDKDAAAFTLDEIKRMDAVMRWFTIYKWIELGLATAGAVTFAIGARKKQYVALGVGAGLTLQSTLMLVLDMFAQARGAEYLRGLAMFRMHALSSPIDSGELAGALLSFSGTF